MKLLVFFFLSVTLTLYAQEPEINISGSRYSLKNVLRLVEEQSGYTFSYESGLLRNMEPISLDIRHSTLSRALEKIFKNTSIEYKITGHHIILKRRKKIPVIHGIVIDAESKETLINATVYDLPQQIGTVTDAYGKYSLSLPNARVALTISFVGYRSWQGTFTLTGDTMISVALQPILKLDEVVVKEQALSHWIKNIQPGQISFPIATVDKLPSLLSESDLLKTIQLLPGVKAGAEGMAGLFVRGGNMDENLYLMDGIPIYNPSHLFGFFSTFNSDAVKNVEFYRGSFPARFGGRLSSVVDVRLKEGNLKEYHGNISIGLIASKFNLEGPLVRNKTAFNISARRTYADFIASPLIHKIAKEDGENIRVGYYFADLNAKITHKFSDQNRLSLCTYWGNDKFHYKEDLSGFSGYEDDWTQTSKEIQKSRWHWGNFITALEWSYNLNNRISWNSSLAYNRYMSIIRLKNTDQNLDPDFPEFRLDNRHFDSGIHDWTVKTDFTCTLNPWHKLRFGSNYTFHTFIPETIHVTIKHNSQELPLESFQNQESKTRGHELSLYAEDEIAWGSKFRIDPGLHFSLFCVEGRTYISAQPRVSFQYAPSDRLSLKASYTEMNQYVHLLTSGGLTMPTDLWVPVTRRVEPMSSRQIAVGIFYHPKHHWNLSLEGYYKTMDHQIDYIDGAGLLPDYRHWDEKVAMGKGVAYGMEVQLQKSQGKTTGWMNYTLAWAKRRYPDGKINYGEWFPARNDNRHGVNIVLMHKFSDRFDISADWVFNSGSRLTLTLENYESTPVLPGGDPPTHGQTIEHYDYRNNYRMENYHRMDIAFNFHKQKKRGMRTWTVSFYNAYCRLNPFQIYSDEYDGKPILAKTTLFPILPSFSYTFTF